jgi:hypothetical protein
MEVIQLPTVTFDTLKFARRLKEAGVMDGHAEAEAEALAEVFQTGLGELATKQDLKALEEATKRDIKELGEATNRNIKELGEATNRNIKELETTTKRDIKELELDIRGEIRLLKWMLGFTLAGVMGILFMLFRLFVVIPSS